MQNAVAVVPGKGLYRGQLVAVISLEERHADKDHGDADSGHCDADVSYDAGRIKPLCPPLSRRAGVQSCIAAASSLLLQRLPAYMVPEMWAVVERLQFLSSGKLDRRQVQAWVEAVDKKTQAKLIQSPLPASPSSAGGQRQRQKRWLSAHPSRTKAAGRVG